MCGFLFHSFSVGLLVVGSTYFRLLCSYCLLDEAIESGFEWTTVGGAGKLIWSYPTDAYRLEPQPMGVYGAFFVWILNSMHMRTRPCVCAMRGAQGAHFDWRDETRAL